MRTSAARLRLPVAHAPALVGLASPLRRMQRLLGLGRARRGPGVAVAGAFPRAVPVLAPGIERSEWPEERLRIAATLWGGGFVGPFGSAFIERIATPLALQSSMSLLYLGAGLGEGVRELARQTGVWVSAYEASAELADLGMERSLAANLTKKAAVSPFDPESATYRPRAFHHAIIEGVLSATVDRERLLAQVSAALRPGGQLVIFDEVAAKRRDGALDPRTRGLWSGPELLDRLAGNGLDIRVQNDLTESYRARVLSGWKRVLTVLEEGPMASLGASAPMVVREFEHWLGRLAAIDAGSLGVFHVRAVKSSGDGEKNGI